jgi:hypothetical protein
LILASRLFSIGFISFPSAEAVKEPHFFSIRQRKINNLRTKNLLFPSATLERDKSGLLANPSTKLFMQAI